MDEVQLRPVTFAELSGLGHETFTSEQKPFLTPEFLVIRYVGVYRPGGEGRGDALYIVSTAKAAREAWYCNSTILDFRELEYVWGDEMEWVTSITWDCVIRYHAPLAIVVGAKCRGALKSLLRDQYATFCVETLEQAYAMGRQKAHDDKKYLKEWHPGSGTASEGSNT
jgi:hypothetical protein